MKKSLILLLALLLAVGLFACKDKETSDATQSPSGNPAVTKKPTESPTATPVDSQKPDPTESPIITEPPVEEGYKIPAEGIKPWAVSIDNQGEIPFPQGGISEAQIVYEIPVEGGLTRYLALFWEADMDLIGPVRSARDYMLDCFTPYDAIFIHVGGSPQALADLKNNPDIIYLNAMINAGYIFEELTDDPKNWQDTFTTAEKVNDYLSTYAVTTVTEKGYVPKYHKELTEGESGLDADTILITYSDHSRCAYIYDSGLKLYFRNRDGKSHIDRNTGEPFGVANIIIQKVNSRVISSDTEGRLEVDMVGSGEGYFISGGKSIDIKWEKDERFGITRYFDGEGNEIVLNPGSTWIQITIASTAILIM